MRKTMRLTNLSALLLVLFISSTTYAQLEIGSNVDGVRLDWRPRHDMLAVSDASTVRIVDATDFITIHTLPEMGGMVTDVKWSADGTLLAIASDHLIEIWADAWNPTDAQKLREIQTPSVPPDFGVTALDWNPDGTQILSVNPMNVYVWDINTSELVRTFEYAMTAAWKPDGRQVVTGDTVGYILSEDLVRGHLYGMEALDRWAIYSFAWHPFDPQLAAGTGNGFVELVSPIHVPHLARDGTLEASGDAVLSLAWNPDYPDVLASGGQDGRLIIWNLGPRRPLVQLELGEPIISLSWASDGERLAYSAGDTFQTIPLPELPLQPIADAGPDQTVLASSNGLANVALDGTASSDPDGTIVEYSWGANNGGAFMGYDASPTVLFRPGVYTITLYIRDDAGLTATDEVKITVEAPTEAYTPPITIEGELVYSRWILQEYDYITITGTTRTVTRVREAWCSAASDDGRYMAYRTTPLASKLVVVDLSTHEIIREFDWSPDWHGCDFFFRPDNRVMVDPDIRQDLTVAPDVYLLDIHTGEVEGPTKPPSFSPQYPPLPDMAYRGWVLKSPTDERYMYARCGNGGEVYIPDFAPASISCSTGMEWVVYDADAQQVIYTLEKTSDYSLTDYPGSSLVGASWSSDGRYLAYLLDLAPGYQTGFPLRIYDFETQQHVEISFIGVDIDQNQLVHWSPDNRKVAVWTTSRVGEEPQPGDENYQSLRVLVIFDLDTLRYTVADTPYDMWINQRNGGYWSPDSQRFAFVNRYGELIYLTMPTNSESDDGYQIRSGVTAILDFGVQQLLDWRAVPSP